MSIESKTTVAELLCRDPITIKSHTKMMDVAALFHEHNISAAPVVDEMDRCIGVLSSSDLVGYLADKVKFSGAELDSKVGTDAEGKIQVEVESFELVGRHMTTTLQTIQPADSIETARKVMVQQGIHHLFVLDDAGRVVGVVSTLDLL